MVVAPPFDVQYPPPSGELRGCLGGPPDVLLHGRGRARSRQPHLRPLLHRRLRPRRRHPPRPTKRCHVITCHVCRSPSRRRKEHIHSPRGLNRSRGIGGYLRRREPSVEVARAARAGGRYPVHDGGSGHAGHTAAEASRGACPGWRSPRRHPYAGEVVPGRPSSRTLKDRVLLRMAPYS